MASVSQPPEASSRIAVVGLGEMGLPIAERILEAGFAVSVFNRTPGRVDALRRRGAALLASPGAALEEADICVTMLAGDEAVESMLLGDAGVLARARPGRTLIEMSTVSVACSERVADAAATAGVGYLRAPVSGNPVAVRSGILTIVVSGPERVAADLDPLLHAIGSKVLYVGEEERARVVKLALQVLVGGTAELLAEALVLGEAAGVEKAKLLEAIGASAVGSPFVAYKSPPLLAGDYSATFSTAMMLKDVGLVLDLAAEGGVELPFATHLQTLLEATAAAGHDDADFMALYLHLRRSSAGGSNHDPNEVRTR